MEIILLVTVWGVGGLLLVSPVLLLLPVGRVCPECGNETLLLGSPLLRPFEQCLLAAGASTADVRTHVEIPPPCGYRARASAEWRRFGRPRAATMRAP